MIVGSGNWELIKTQTVHKIVAGFAIVHLGYPQDIGGVFTGKGTPYDTLIPDVGITEALPVI